MCHDFMARNEMKWKVKKDGKKIPRKADWSAK